MLLLSLHGPPVTACIPQDAFDFHSRLDIFLRFFPVTLRSRFVFQCDMSHARFSFSVLFECTMSRARVGFSVMFQCTVSPAGGVRGEFSLRDGPSRRVTEN